MRSNLLRSKTFWLSVAAGMLFSALVLGKGMVNSNQQGGDTRNFLSGAEDVNELLSILRNEVMRGNNPERVAQVIERLGRMRGVAAIDDLVQLITFRRTFAWENSGVDLIDEDHPVTPLGRYPAAGALFEIGKASLPALTKVIEAEESDSLASENAIYTLGKIFRDQPAQAVKYLKDAAEQAPSPKAAQKLSQATRRLAKSVQR